jgi:hypothetical protein
MQQVQQQSDRKSTDEHGAKHTDHTAEHKKKLFGAQKPGGN